MSALKTALEQQAGKVQESAKTASAAEELSKLTAELARVHANLEIAEEDLEYLKQQACSHLPHLGFHSFMTQFME